MLNQDADPGSMPSGAQTKASVKPHCWAPAPESLTQEVWGEAQESASPESSQVMLMLPAQAHTYKATDLGIFTQQKAPKRQRWFFSPPSLLSQPLSC